MRKKQTGNTFKNCSEVHRWLIDNGYRVARASVYTAFSEGKLQMGTSGKFSLKSVQEYAKTLKQKATGKTEEQTEFDDRIPSKDTLDRLLRAEKLKKMQFARKIEESKYIERNQIELELASRGATFQNDLEHFAYSKAGDIIESVGGDHKKTPELSRYLLNQFHEILNRYASPIQITVEIADQENN